MKDYRHCVKLVLAILVLSFTVPQAAVPGGMMIVAEASASKVNKTKLDKTKLDKTRLDKTKAVVFVEQIMKLNVLGTKEKVKWSSSNQKIASVTQYGTVRGMKAGKAVITAAIKDKKYQCTVTVQSQIGVKETNITCSEDMDIPVINYNSGEDTVLNYAIEEQGIVTCQWQEWNDLGTKLPLTIIPIKHGTTRIIITSTTSSEKLILTVTVPKSFDDGSKALSGEQIYARASKATVELRTFDYNKAEDALGTGFFISDGVIVTNYHVIEGATYIKAYANDGGTYEVESILGFDIQKDIAILMVNSVNSSLKLSSRKVLTGETIYTLGSSEGLRGTFSNGIVSTASRMVEGINCIQITAPISSGNSGGPLLNKYGEVIGINAMGYYEGQNLNFAISVRELANIDLSSPKRIDTMSGSNSDNILDIVYEDASLSGNRDTAQLLYDGDFVKGSVKSAEELDYYHVKIEKQGRFMAALGTYGSDAYSNYELKLCDADGDVIASSETEKDFESQKLVKELKPGDYYISVSTKILPSESNRDYALIISLLPLN